MSEYNPVEIQMSTRYDSELMTKKTPASKEEELLARKKCKKCSLFYNEATNNECHYHPGVFMEPTGVDAMVGWSCCRVSEKIKPPGMPLLSLLNDNALKKDSKGCTKAEKHVEDDTYSVPASQFPFDYEEYQKKSEEITAAQPEPVTPVKPEDETKNAPPGFYRHKIVEGDTLVGLSLKYKIPLDTLKKVNHLFSHQIFHLKEILIPITEEFNLPKLEEPNPQKEATKAFKRKTGASLEEAKFYLEESNWNVETAIKEYEQDTKYEKEQLANNNKPVGSRDVSVKSPKESRFKIFARKTVIC